MHAPRIRAALAATALAAGLLATVGAGAQEQHTVTHETVTSFDGTEIAISIFRPAGADAASPVPVLLHSHGWSGSRATSVSSVQSYLNAGFGVVSIDQRGHGQSGGQATVHDPDIEGQDNILVIDRVAELDWVLLDEDANGNPIAGDPVLGALGGSYGGGYQFITALTEVRDAGSTRFNALAPDITWHNLSQSLAPADVPRTIWVTLLYAVGAGMVPDWIHEAFLLGAATGTYPDGTIPGTVDIKQIFYEHSPQWFSDKGIQLDIPVLITQGTSDNLFPLNEAWRNYEDVLTPGAQDKSLVVAYNGGHALPNVLPLGDFGSLSGDACSGGRTSLTIDFYTEAFAGGDPSSLLPAPYSLTTADGANCIHVDSLDPTVAVPVGVDGTIVTPAGAGAPLQLPLLTGPATLAGIPFVTGQLTTAGVDARAFFGLSLGTTPADAMVIQNNLMPVRRLLPVVDEQAVIELPGVAVQIPAGQTLYLTVTAVSDMFIGHGSRVPGAVVLTDAAVELPLVL